MNTEYILQAKPRESIGTATSKKIRRENGIPAVVYGDVDNSNIVLDANEVAKQVRDSGFYSSVIKLTIDKNTIDVILKDLQRDPRKSFITHMDFFAVDKNKAVVVTGNAFPAPLITSVCVPILALIQESGVDFKRKLSQIDLEVLSRGCLAASAPSNRSTKPRHVDNI